MSMGQHGDEPTVGQLVANASKDLSSLVRSEVELAKTELKKTAIAAGTGAGMFAAAAFLALLAVILLCNRRGVRSWSRPVCTRRSPS